MKNTVLITGCFDILHPGHIRMFDFIFDNFPNHSVVIALDSDYRVKLLKGESRPINNQYDREFMLRRVKVKGPYFTIEVFDTDRDLELLCEKYNNHIRILGGDYHGKPIIGERFSSAIIYFKRIDNYSTTKIIDKINEKNTVNS